MCYSPITIINPSKYVDIRRHDRFLLQVPCGQCAECQKSKSLEWSFRTYYEFLRTYEEDSRSYVYFDTLTYDDAHLPHMDEVVEELPPYPCFRTSDVVKFLKRLRQRLSRQHGISEDAFSYFLCSEYGSLKGRPHYHILIFIRQYVSPLSLSALVSKAWTYGRTDGIPYRDSFYVNQHNVLKLGRLGDTLACVNYVTKYVEKDCKLQDIINKRIKQAEVILSKKFDGMKSNSVQFKKLLTAISKEVNQFHLQSLHFGELAIRDIDLLQLVRDGCLTMPSHQVITKVPLPTYFARKLFYDKYKLYGNYGWQLNDDGKRYKAARLPHLQKQLTKRLECLSLLGNIRCNCADLADYVLTKRGRYKDAVSPESVMSERIDSITHYVYSCQSDKEHVGCGVSLEFLGNSKIGYQPFTSDIIKFKDFVAQYVYLDDAKEELLKCLYSTMNKINEDAQNYYSRVQELKSLFKQFERL